MIIVLPNDNKGLPILLRTLRLSYDLLTKALNEMVTVTVDVTIPKFKIETALDLKSYYEKVRVMNNKEIIFECEARAARCEADIEAYRLVRRRVLWTEYNLPAITELTIDYKISIILVTSTIRQPNHALLITSDYHKRN